MTFEWIGLAAFILGCVGLAAGRGFSLVLFLVSTLLGAASAAILTVIGGANLPPAHLLLGFLFLLALSSPWRGVMAEAIAWPRPGFWLFVTVAYGVVTAVFMPRLFANATYVYTFARTDYGTGLLLVPLGPVSGNITQTIYFVGDLLAYCVVTALACDDRGKIWVAKGLIVCGFANLAFAGLDYLTFFTGTADYLAFMRNAPYRILDTAEVIGIKRLVGSFPEASAFAGATLCLFAFTLTLWLEGYRSRLVAPLAALLLLALVASTSTTAYAGLALYLAFVYAASVLRLVFGTVTRMRVAFLIYAPVAFALLGCIVAIDDRSATFVGDALQQLVFLKGATASAAERATWNAQALTNFAETYGLGVGIGSARASNVAVAVLANLGIIGTITYGLFLVNTLTMPARDPAPHLHGIRQAAASACIAMIFAGLLAGTTIDLGLTFFICAALAATPAAEPASARLPSAPEPEAETRLTASEVPA
ncbi:MAG: hypothetical protein K2Y56_10850 [Methylobacterium sp.]|uniref:hypothetical protein n=1 Tax=Methylobacterium sp. TaxID=409 RepID=UPI0025F20790|nr:hypothetical protein [Methylobacterium sp.]MBX9932019.1 hypothetical protein [Methylobacterium sp.]